MFLEQAAISYLSAPSMLRKYAMHLIIAGHRYIKFGENLFGKRCYDAALKIYKDSEWRIIEDHLNFNLGKQAINGSEPKVAMRHFIRLLHASRQTASNQRIYLSEFLFAYQQCALEDPGDMSGLIADLNVPEIVPGSFELRCNGQAKSSAVEDPEKSEWAQLEYETISALNFSRKKTEQLIAAPLGREKTSLSCSVGGKFFHKSRIG